MSQTVPPGPDGHDPYHEAPSKGFTAWARLVVRHPWLALLASVALMALSGWLAATNTRVDTSVEAFADHHSEARRLLDEYRAEFGRDDVLMVLVEGDVFSVDYLTRLKALHQALAALDLGPEPPSALAARAAAAKAHTTAPSAPPTTSSTRPTTPRRWCWWTTRRSTARWPRCTS